MGDGYASQDELGGGLVCNFTEDRIGSDRIATCHQQ